MSFFTNLRAFLNDYSWNCYNDLKGLGFTLVLLFFTLGMIINLFGRKGNGEEIFSLLSRSVIVIFALVFFRQIVEGFKDLVWAIELQIHSVSFESQVASLFNPSDKNLSTYLLGIFLLIAKLLFFLLQLAFSYLWVFCIAAAPLLIPMFLSPFFEGYAEKWLSFTVGLLLVRIPWALLAKCMAVLSVQKFDGFMNGSFAAITLPLFLGILAVAASAFVLTGGGSMIGPGIGLLAGMKFNALNMAGKGKSSFLKGQTALAKFAGAAADKIIPKGSPSTMSSGLADGGFIPDSNGSVPQQASSSQVAAGKDVKLNPVAVAASKSGSVSSSAQSTQNVAAKNTPQKGAPNASSKGNVPSQVAAGKDVKLNPVAVAASKNKLPSQSNEKIASNTGKVIPKTGLNTTAPSGKGSVEVLKS